MVGAGTVGGATGRWFSERGHHVTFCDQSEDVVRLLSDAGHLALTPDELTLDGVQYVFVCVGTPHGDHGVDPSALFAATDMIGRKIGDSEGFPTVIFRSTQPPGTTRNALIPLLTRTSGFELGEGYGVAYWPEYLRAAHADSDFANPRAVLLATEYKNDISHHAALRLTLELPTGMHWLPLEAAELQKYVHNCGNAIKISTYNWFRLLADSIGVKDIEYIIQLSVITAEGLYNPEYGTRDLGPYVGDCLPKDLKTLLEYAKTAGVQTGLLEAVESINREIARSGRIHQGDC